MNLMVTARLPGTDGTSNGSSFILRTMRPNAFTIGLKISSTRTRYRVVYNLGNSVERPADVENTLRIPGDAFGNHDPGTTLLSNFINVRPALPNDNGGVLSYNQASHVNVGRRGWSCGGGT